MTVLRYFLATNLYCHFVLAITDAYCKMTLSRYLILIVNVFLIGSVQKRVIPRARRIYMSELRARTSLYKYLFIRTRFPRTWKKMCK